MQTRTTVLLGVTLAGKRTQKDCFFVYDRFTVSMHTSQVEYMCSCLSYSGSFPSVTVGGV